MDALCLKAGIHGMAAPPIAAAAGTLDFRLSASSAEKPSVSAAPPRNLPWGFTFRRPLRSLWPGSKIRYEPAISAADDAVLAEEKEEINERANENWVGKILHVTSLWKERGENGKLEEAVRVKLEEECENAVDEIANSFEECESVCDVCAIDDEEDEDEKIEFDRESFSKLLRKVPLAEARLYAQLSYLGNLAYSISQIKPGNLLRRHGLQFVTSSLDKKEHSLKHEKQTESSEKEANEDSNTTERGKRNHVTASAAYQIAASAASYLHSHTKSILGFRSTNATTNENAREDMMNDNVASLMATTDSVTAVVAAKEEVKQAVADDLNSTLLSPCNWFVCDDDRAATRFFVIQGSESLASWQANLLFEPVKFEGLDVLVHRGIYEAAKGIYEQMLPEILAHLKTHGDRATFRFTGHSLGGSLSVLVNLMLLIRGEAPRSSLLPAVTFGAPSIMCGGDRLLRNLGLPRNHVRSIAMHLDIVPRVFSCDYPNHVAEFLKAINGNFRNHPCLDNQKLLYSPMGEFLILQPDDKFSPSHDLLPPGSGLYLLTCPASDITKAEKQIHAAQAIFLNSPHPLEILSDPSAYGSGGTIQRDHDMNSYLKSIRNVIRQELSRIKKAKRDRQRRVWWPLVALSGVSAGVIVSRPVTSGNNILGRGRVEFSGMVRTSGESLKRFGRFVASQHMHLLVVVLLPARLLVLGSSSFVQFH